MKKWIPFLFFIVFVFFSCTNLTSGQNEPGKNKEQYATLKIFNTSSYYVSVHRDSFSGVVIAELASGELKQIEIPVSDHYGVGSTFSIGYKTKVFNDVDSACGDVYAYGIDPDMQITMNIEREKDNFLKIEQPANLVFETAFLRIINSSDNYFELRKNSISYKQTGNGNVPVESGKIGIYEIDSSSAGKEFKDYELRTVFNSVKFPEFPAKYNHSYTFIYDGTSITKYSEENLIY